MIASSWRVVGKPEVIQITGAVRNRLGSPNEEQNLNAAASSTPTAAPDQCASPLSSRFF
jgi:hypothetical protein